MSHNVAPTPDELGSGYAKIIARLVTIGLAILVLTFLIAAVGILPSDIAPESVAASWHLSASEFTETVGQKSGWSWIERLPAGDAVSEGALTFIAGITIVALAILLFTRIKRLEPAYVAIVGFQIVVLILAAAGVVSGH